MSKVAVIGAGSWGTALAMVLCDNHHDVRIWTHNTEQKQRMEQEGKNQKYLPDIPLPSSLTIHDDLALAVEEVEAIVLVVPTKAIRETCQRLDQVLRHQVVMIHASKGIEPDSHYRISEMINEELDSTHYQEVAVLSGPSHAEEVSLKHPTTVTAASEDESLASFTQDLFMNQYFRVYTSTDVIGVELGGALKNIIALGAGISDGLGYGDNAKAALITRGLAEITRLASVKGANPLTFIGLTGVGDLIVTCTSSHSRNWRAGNLLGQGLSLDEVLSKMGMVVEGIRTTEAVTQLGQEEKIEMPITTGIYDVIHQNKSPKKVVDELMARDRTTEIDDISDILFNRDKD
ncbi:NAD(P)H-dependent glycerol-3-phosphate dehydrogenase [Gracilibacillus caseinilyticus]|uniref:Glycerol-3-phosphate dehydrogenase [NAD(P)+] n=1 Tax=Gracilibacillus caseinilyticus TaxID=2932256 RepID=A0ABY4EUK3_9BACI|nr:NAD(P)H-dependent glycerol-3-phosphate dehydrogenase [Gracilibacillus caseinilyticus]UOQ47568.1 NAD(P)H-dependent glycerol-3-phosphate dehydrogenase [Gracilibacillus caseinilyticus]